ncbi:hypothetical protein BH09GEM1_BH09GEM1_06580 [soil metagenome]
MRVVGNQNGAGYLSWLEQNTHARRVSLRENVEVEPSIWAEVRY